MNILCIFNYQREVPPFMQMQIGIARKYFDKIYYFTRHMTSNNSETIAYDNVKVVEVSALTRNLMFMGSPVHALFNRYCLTNFLKSLDIKRLKAQATTIFTSDCLYLTARDTVKKHLKANDNVYMLATWFSTEAYTVARFNKNYNLSKTVSFAHSFEIDPDKNRYVAYSFNLFKHQYLDRIHYISHEMRDIYYDATAELNISNKDEKDSAITYIGSTKSHDGFCKPSDDQVFRIVSCSSVTPVKRLGLIIDALRSWEVGTLEWTHMGSGPLFDWLTAESDKLMRGNSNIRVNLTGAKSNKDVQQFYIDNRVDLFVNVSEAEGVPVSIMEAMSYGIPCLATNVGGTSEIVNTETGILIDKDTTPAEICNQLRTFADKQESEKQTMREDAYRQWADKFDANCTMNEFYSSLLR